METEATNRNRPQWQTGQTAAVDDLKRLRMQRELGRRYLPFLKTLADFDIACEVGLHEVSGAPLTVKQLMLLDIAPAVTVFRRLDRLCAYGAVLRTQSNRDRRVHELRLAPDVHRLFAVYLRPETLDAVQAASSSAVSKLRLSAPSSQAVECLNAAPRRG